MILLDAKLAVDALLCCHFVRAMLNRGTLKILMSAILGSVHFINSKFKYLLTFSFHVH